ncbi:MAG TPA: amidase [Acetobacteraceae bacterium]|nr:amidase [Acetobacteraceae bacterium]
MSAEPEFSPIAELAPRLRAGSLSPVALCERILDRIHRYDSRLESYEHVSESALGQARRAEAEIRGGAWRGPLHGVPIAIKDNTLTADMPTTAGTRAPGIEFPLVDSAVAERLRAAGAVLIGKTRTHEFAWGTTTPPTRNPWREDRIPGGSSGGSGAALAAGLCLAATGSDTGGSVRIPASFCGVVGLKPTFGRISRRGIVPHSWSLDHPGPLTRSVADAAILLGVMAGYDPADSASRDTPVPDYAEAVAGGVSGLRVAVIRNHFFERNQPAVDQTVEAAIDWFAGEGARVHDVQLPSLEYGLGAIFAIELSSSTAYHDVSLRAGRSAGFAPDVRRLVQFGRFVTGADYLKAEQFRHVLMNDYARLFETADVVLGPTEPITAPPVGADIVALGPHRESALAATWRLTYPYNLTGLPAITLPCGFDDNGLPIGLQIAGRPFDEATVLRAAAAYEKAHAWHEQRPPN